MNISKLEIWKEYIQECKASECTVSEWCQQHQLSKATYYYWFKKINSEAVAESKPVFAEVTAKLVGTSLDSPNALHIQWNQISVFVTSPQEAELAAVFLERLQRLC